MYLAELHGKISSRISEREDILTSNVFSFFNYCQREYFLKSFLELIDIYDVSDKELTEAEFYFWPKYDDGTEPDLVLIVGKYYLLIEAKYGSSFSIDANGKNQLEREFISGKKDADTKLKQFMLIAITADYVYPSDKIPQNLKHKIKWINWHRIALLLETKLNNLRLTKETRNFVNDLYQLLIKKGLRFFGGIISLSIFTHEWTDYYTNIFFNYQNAIYRDKFIGFKRSLIDSQVIVPMKQIFFPIDFFQFKINKYNRNKLNKIEEEIFFKTN